MLKSIKCMNMHLKSYSRTKDENALGTAEKMAAFFWFQASCKTPACTVYGCCDANDINLLLVHNKKGLVSSRALSRSGASNYAYCILTSISAKFRNPPYLDNIYEFLPKWPSIYDVHKKSGFWPPSPCPHASTWVGSPLPLWTSTRGRHEIHG